MDVAVFAESSITRFLQNEKTPIFQIDWDTHCDSMRIGDNTTENRILFRASLDFFNRAREQLFRFEYIV